MHFQRKRDFVNNEGNGWKELKYEREFYRRVMVSERSKAAGECPNEGLGAVFYFLKISNLDDILNLFHRISVR